MNQRLLPRVPKYPCLYRHPLRLSCYRSLTSFLALYLCLFSSPATPQIYPVCVLQQDGLIKTLPNSRDAFDAKAIVLHPGECANTGPFCPQNIWCVCAAKLETNKESTFQNLCDSERNRTRWTREGACSQGDAIKYDCQR